MNVWIYLGPLLAGLGGLGVGVGNVWAQRNKSKMDKVEYHNSLLVSMQGHLDYMSKENESQRTRLDALTEQVRIYQNDKYEMQAKLAEYERKWEERLRGTTPAT